MSTALHNTEEAILKMFQKLVLIQIKFLFFFFEKYTTDMITNRMRNIHTSMVYTAFDKGNL